MGTWIVYACLAFLGYKLVWPKIHSSEPEKYYLLDIPPFTIPMAAGESEQSVRSKYIPQIELVWGLPPSILISVAWPIQYTQRVELSAEMTGDAAQTILWAVRNGLHATRVEQILLEGQRVWRIDIPPIKIPTGKER